MNIFVVVRFRLCGVLESVCEHRQQHIVLDNKITNLKLVLYYKPVILITVGTVRGILIHIF